MEHHVLYEKVELFIQGDKLDDAMLLLTKYARTQETIALSARLERLRTTNIMGTSSDDVYITERNKIRDAMLSCCQRLRVERRHSKNGSSEMEGFESSGDESVATQVGTMEIEIKINRDFNTYSVEDREKLLRAIRNILEIEGDIKIKHMKKGSVLLTLELTPEQCERLHWAIQKGEFEEFDIVDSKVNEGSGTNIENDYPDYNYINEEYKYLTKSEPEGNTIFILINQTLNLNHEGFYNINRNRFLEAENNFDEALKIYKIIGLKIDLIYPNNISTILNRLWNTYIKIGQGKEKEAIAESFMEASKIFEEIRFMNTPSYLRYYIMNVRDTLNGLLNIYNRGGETVDRLWHKGL